MVSQQERARLVEAYKNEPVYVAAVIAKCSACLLILAGLALIGGGIDSTGDDPGRSQQAQGRESAPASLSRTRLQEPRAHLDGQGGPGTDKSVNCTGAVDRAASLTC
jgi:hypothetical protein